MALIMNESMGFLFSIVPLEGPQDLWFNTEKHWLVADIDINDTDQMIFNAPPNLKSTLCSNLASNRNREKHLRYLDFAGITMKYSKAMNLFFQTLPVQTDRQATMTGISPSRLLRTISRGRDRIGVNSLMPKNAIWIVNHLTGRSQRVPQGICSICLLRVLHSSPPSCSSYMTVFSHHTQSLSGGVMIIWLLVEAELLKQIHSEIVCWISY